MMWIKIDHPLLLRMYRLKYNRKGTKNPLVPKWGIPLKLYVTPDTYDIQELLIMENPYLPPKKRLQNKAKAKGKEITATVGNKNITLPQSMLRLNAKQKNFIMLLHSDFYDREYGTWTRGNEAIAWLMVYCKPIVVESYGYFDENEKGERYKFHFHNRGRYLSATANAQMVLKNAKIKLAIDELLAEIFGNKDELRNKLLNDLVAIKENPLTKSTNKIKAISEIAKLAGISKDEKIVEHRLVDASEQRKIIGQLSGKENPFANVGKEYTAKELMSDDKVDNNIQ